MPSSLAAALAASKKNAAETTTMQQPKDEPAKALAPSSLAQYQRQQNKNDNEHLKKHAQAEKLINKNDTPASKYLSNKNTPNNKDRKGGGKFPQKRNTSCADDHNTAVEEIVFICDIPSSDDEDDEVHLDSLQITDKNRAGSGGRRHRDRGNPNERGGRPRCDRDKRNRNKDGEVLNVNASRRMIGHALGRRLGPSPNISKESNNNNMKSNTSSSVSNPGVMPTPWSKKAQEMKNGNKINYSNEMNSRWSNRDVSKQSDGNNSPQVKKIPASQPAQAPKLESAKLKGRWADEDSSDDE